MEQHILKLTAGLLISYLVGSVPTAYSFGKIRKGIDLRHYGSGNLGATNAFRVLGKGLGTTVLVIDILKGTAAVCLCRYLFYAQNDWLSLNLYLCLAAVAVVCGHNWTVFLGFKGGKGVATSLGVLLGFTLVIDKFILIVAAILLLWLLVFIPSGYVSLASMVCSLVLPVLGIAFRLPGEIILFLLALSVVSLIKHKSNISRLLEKKESRFDTKSFLKKLVK